MALPKEPRQKMINMMYLVLTALLALNVSSEIINAFETVNNSITTSNQIISDKNALTYQSLDEKKKDQQTAAKAAIWAPKAEAAKALAASMYSEIQNLKNQLAEYAGSHEENGEQKMNADKLDASTRLLEKEGKGEELYKKIDDFKKKLIGVLDPNDPAFAENPATKAAVAKAVADFQKSLPIDLTVPKSTSGNKYENNANGWTMSNFHMTPAIAAMTILNKLQNDVRNSEAQVIDFCHQQIGAVKLVYDQFEAIAQANRTYAMPGDPIEITAGIGAFSEAAKPEIFIGGKQMQLERGKAIYKTTASGAGTQKINVKIRYTTPDGEVKEKNEIVEYTIGTPSGASVFLQKMNVLYIGVDNPMTISGGSVGAEKVRVSFSNGEISKSGGDNYVARPRTPGMADIVVNADGKSYKFPMRVKYLPNPAAFLGTKKSGNIGAAEFKAIGGIIAKLEDSDFEAPYKVVSYRFGAQGGPIQVYAEATNNGNRWSGQAAQLVSRTGPGSVVFFDNITVIGPDGKQRDIGSMSFKLK
ncbi:gliding motility protein GldM [Pseudoflavitalea rhizosphaerae]|uniref:type IX secretion system motor protein PorM/GldM n=1 Tax=Pseudoflavitalea rhizosphaerae TaxID=1884793 RepID=UPI000F8CED75|nr:gliding motility protein GldM [Pseudoflavitalea rhizosphaerae]